MVCNFGKEWQYGSVVTTTQYSPFNPVQIQAEVGLHLGLRGINVTLVGMPINQANETINYNEIFSWEWQQGILGHGPYGGRISREQHEATGRGVPYPILWVAEWFTLEGEYIHWGRFARVAGWYTHILMWIAMCFWGVTNIMFLSNAFHGALGLVATGCTMVLANIVFAGVQNQNHNALVIHFPDGAITLAYGWCFIYNLVTGLLCIVGGIIVAILAKFGFPKQYFFAEEPNKSIKSEVIKQEEEDEELDDMEKNKKDESESTSESSDSESSEKPMVRLSDMAEENKKKSDSEDSSDEPKKKEPEPESKPKPSSLVSSADGGDKSPSSPKKTKKSVTIME